MHKVEDHLRLVGKIAMRYSKTTRMEFDDLYQEGCIGLMRACREYKEGEVPFGAFAGQHIKFSILNALKLSNIIRSPSTVVHYAGIAKREGLEDEDFQIIAEKLKISEVMAKRVIEHLKREILSIDFEYNRNGDEAKSLEEFIKNETDFDSRILYEQLTEDLKPKEKIVLEMALAGYEHSEIAPIVNLTRRSVNTYAQIVKKKIRQHKGEIYGV